MKVTTQMTLSVTNKSTGYDLQISVDYCKLPIWCPFFLSTTHLIKDCRGIRSTKGSPEEVEGATSKDDCEFPNINMVPVLTSPSLYAPHVSLPSPPLLDGYNPIIMVDSLGLSSTCLKSKSRPSNQGTDMATITLMANCDLCQSTNGMAGRRSIDVRKLHEEGPLWAKNKTDFLDHQPTMQVGHGRQRRQNEAQVIYSSHPLTGQDISHYPVI